MTDFVVLMGTIAIVVPCLAFAYVKWDVARLEKSDHVDRMRYTETLNKLRILEEKQSVLTMGCGSLEGRIEQCERNIRDMGNPPVKRVTTHANVGPFGVKK